MIVLSDLPFAFVLHEFFKYTTNANTFLSDKNTEKNISNTYNSI